MGLFSRNFDTPGPGVNRNTPRKKGIGRFFELLGRDSGSFFKANLWCAAAMAPTAFIVSFGIFSKSVLFTLLGGLVGGLVLAPFYAGMHDTVLRAMRDEPGYWWHVYKRAMKNNWKESLVPGMLLGALISSILLALSLALDGTLQLTAVTGVCLVLSLLLITMCAPYLWSQLVLMDLTFPQLLKNTLLFALSNAPRSLLVAFIQIIYWGAIIVLQPVTSLWVLLFGFAFIVLITVMITFPAMDKILHIEEQLIARREAEEEEFNH